MRARATNPPLTPSRTPMHPPTPVHLAPPPQARMRAVTGFSRSLRALRTHRQRFAAHAAELNQTLRFEPLVPPAARPRHAPLGAAPTAPPSLLAHLPAHVPAPPFLLSWSCCSPRRPSCRPRRRRASGGRATKLAAAAMTRRSTTLRRAPCSTPWVGWVAHASTHALTLIHARPRARAPCRRAAACCCARLSSTRARRARCLGSCARTDPTSSSCGR